MFNLEVSAIYQAVKMEKHPAFRYTGFFKKIFLILFIFFFLIFLFGFFTDAIKISTLSFLFSFSLIFLVFFFVGWISSNPNRCEFVFYCCCVVVGGVEAFIS